MYWLDKKREGRAGIPFESSRKMNPEKVTRGMNKMLSTSDVRI